MDTRSPLAAEAARLSVRNITRVYRAASAEERAEGQNWYREARALAETLDPADPERGAAVLAVLSPRLSWDRNVTAAHDVYAGRHPRTLKGNAAKAFTLLHCGPGERDGVVRGAKVRAFWQTITDPTNPTAVVIDRHAIDIAAGRVLGEAGRDAVLSRRAAYEEVAELYRRAAKVLSREYGPLSPAEVQATTWVHWRRNPNRPA